MKIVHVIGSLEMGGAEKLLKDLLPQLKRKNNDVSLLVIGSGNLTFVNLLEKKGISVILLNKSNIYNPLNIFSIIKSLRGFKYVHVHLFPALYFVSIVKIFNPRLILFYTEHNTSNKRRRIRFLKYLERIIYWRYSIIISISTDTQLNLVNWLSSNNKLDKYCIVENGINIEEYYSAKPLNLDNIYEKKIILMVSRFSMQKDHETLIRAFKIIANTRNDVLLFFAGEGETMERMKKIVNELSLDSLVCFLGNRNDISNLMNLSYIGVQSSHWEGFGLTAVEFMASGKPIVASNVKGLSNVVKDAGLLYETGDYQNLAEIILHLLEDENFHAIVSQKCLNRAQLYSIESTANGYLEIYKKFI